MSGIQGATIALLEARMSSEVADMIRRYGGKPYCAPAVREMPVNSQEQVSAFIDHLSRSSIQIVVFFTGVGITALFREAERLGRLPELLDDLGKVTAVCRGPKPSAVLRRYNVPITINAEEPYTTDDLLIALSQVDVQGKHVAVVHYGERSIQLAEVLQQRGAQLEELLLYEWQLPEDIDTLRRLVRDILERRVDAVVFTSQIQVRHLFLIAQQMEVSTELVHALQSETVVASVGPTCTKALEDYHVRPHVEPQHPKIGHLLKALVEYMDKL
jgi:uroporphyrinogen-III synthase